MKSWIKLKRVETQKYLYTPKVFVAEKVKSRRQKMKALKRLKAEKLKKQKAGTGTGIKY